MGQDVGGGRGDTRNDKPKGKIVKPPKRDGQRKDQEVRKGGYVWKWNGNDWIRQRKATEDDKSVIQHARDALDPGGTASPDEPSGGSGGGAAEDNGNSGGGGGDVSRGKKGGKKGGGGGSGDGRPKDDGDEKVDTDGDGELSDKELRNATIESYPSLEIYLDHPEVGPLLRKAAEKGWSRNRLEAEIKDTKWWRRHSNREREIANLRNTNPGEYRSLLKAEVERVRDLMESEGQRRWGYDVIKRIAEQALRFGWSDSQLQAAVEKNKRFRERSDSEQEYYRLKFHNREEWRSRYGLARKTVAEMAKSLGVKLGSKELRGSALKLFREGWSEEQLRSHLVSKVDLGKAAEGRSGELGDNARQVQDLFKAYMLPMSNKVQNRWTLRILQGKASVEQLEEHLKKLAKGQYNGMEDALDKGLTVEEFVDPYRQRIAQLYDISPDAIDFDKPKWRNVLTGGQDKDGKPRVMTLSEAEQYARGREEWQYTKAAEDEYAEFGQELAQMWGLEG